MQVKIRPNRSVTYSRKWLINSHPSIFFSFFNELTILCLQNVWFCNCVDDLQAANSCKLPPHLLSLPSARIKYRKKIFFFCLRQDWRIKEWIIFGKRISSSLWWAASRRDVLLITQCGIQENILTRQHTHSAGRGFKGSKLPTLQTNRSLF